MSPWSGLIASLTPFGNLHLGFSTSGQLKNQNIDIKSLFPVKEFCDEALPRKKG